MLRCAEIVAESLLLAGTALVAYPALRVSWVLARVNRHVRRNPDDDPQLAALRDSTAKILERIATAWNRSDSICLVAGVVLQVLASVIKLAFLLRR